MINSSWWVGNNGTSMRVVTSSLAGGSHYLISGIWKSGNCDPQSKHLWMFWNAECLPSDVRESNFVLLLSTAGRWKQWPFSRCSQPWFCLLFQSLPLFYSTGTEMAEPSHRTILPPAQCCKQSLCHVLDFFHKGKKKTLTRSKATFQSKVNMRRWLAAFGTRKNMSFQ